MSGRETKATDGHACAAGRINARTVLKRKARTRRASSRRIFSITRISFVRWAPNDPRFRIEDHYFKILNSFNPFERIVKAHTNHRRIPHRHFVIYPSASKHSAKLRCRQVNIGVSRKVNELAFVSRSSCTRSRKSAGWSVSKATTNSWSSSPKE